LEAREINVPVNVNQVDDLSFDSYTWDPSHLSFRGDFLFEYKQCPDP
jgi:hypothetical protein